MRIAIEHKNNVKIKDTAFGVISDPVRSVFLCIGELIYLSIEYYCYCRLLSDQLAQASVAGIGLYIAEAGSYSFFHFIIVISRLAAVVAVV